MTDEKIVGGMSAEKDTKSIDEKVETLIEQSKKNGLSEADIDAAMEEMEFDVDSIDKLYEV